MRKFLTIICVTVFLASCGGKKSGGSNGISKDTKADYQMDDKMIDSLGEKGTPAVTPYEGKIIEAKGIIKSFKKSVTSASPNKYSFYLCADAAQEDTKCIICYTDSDQSANVGKTVTVKGKFDYAGVVTLDDCVVY